MISLYLSLILEGFILLLEDQNDIKFQVTLKRVFYVPGLAQRLFSVPAFSANWQGQKVTSPPVRNQNPFLSAVPANLKNLGLTTNAQDERKAVPVELLHQRLGHTRTNTLLYTSQHHCWTDIVVVMVPEKFCDPCQVVTTRSNNHCKIPQSNPLEPGHTVYMDLLPPISPISLTPATTFKCYLF